MPFTPLVDPEAPFGRKLMDHQVLSVAAAAISRRWSYNTIANAFGLSRSAVIRMRHNRHGRYKRIDRVLASMSEDEFVRAYLDEDTVNRIEETIRLSKTGTR